MHFPGAHCEHPGCNVFDYLDVKCTHCRKVFCKEHYSVRDHTCVAVPDTATSVTNPRRTLTLPRCGSCGIVDYAGVQCLHCHTVFCVEHRFPEEHKCPHAPKPETQPKVGARRLGTNKVSGGPAKPLMLGKVPMHRDDEWPLHVAVIPKQVERRVIACRRWSVGKTVDALVDAIPETDRKTVNGRWRLAVQSGGGPHWFAADMLASLVETVPYGHDGRVLLVPEALVEEAKDSGIVRLIPSMLPHEFRTCGAEALSSQKIGNNLWEVFTSAITA